MTGEDLQIFVETSIACKEAIAQAERAEAALGAVPWQTLLNIYECLTLPAVALDGDVDTLASFLNQYAPWVPNESEERDDMEPPNRDFTTTGDFRRARGVIPWQPGDEPAETTIRRLRDAPERAERAEAVVSAIPWQTLLNISNYRDLLLERDSAALDAFLNQYAPWARPSDNDSASDA